MHPNPAFRQAPETLNLAFARDRGFGIVSLNAPDGPLLAHIPFLLSDDGRYIDLHLTRSNPIIALLTTPQPAVIAVSGPDSYISPDWYGVPDQVPTWNYIAIHLRGTLERLPDADLRPMLDQLSATFEARLLPKKPWVSTKMTDGLLDRMMRAIIPCRLAVLNIQGTWKLNQNKPDPVRHAAAAQVATAGQGQEIATLSALMHGAHPV